MTRRRGGPKKLSSAAEIVYDLAPLPSRRQRLAELRDEAVKKGDKETVREIDGYGEALLMESQPSLRDAPTPTLLPSDGSLLE